MNKMLETQLVKKINELYITTRKKYLIMDSEGKYRTVSQPLTDKQIRQHLQHRLTIGVFSGEQVAKFLCFDLDIEDKQLLNWAYFLLIECLNELGVSDEYIHLANSGNKGYHVLIYIENGTSLNNVKSLFDVTMKLIISKLDDSLRAELLNEKGRMLDLTFGKIEMRSTFSQGVKLELGVNFKNKNNFTNRCLFMDKETLKMINDDDYLLSINPMSKEEFNNLINEVSDDKENNRNIKPILPEANVRNEKQLIETTLKEPHSHKINKDENETISHIISLIENGMTTSGTRHNSIFKISRYFSYMGLNEEESLKELKKWMSWQDTKYYSISTEEALQECERINELVYEKGYTIVGNIENIKVSKNEIKQIMQIKDKNAKIILYAMLIHSKRYANAKGVFYLSFNQIEEMTGLGIDAGLSNIKKLEESGYIEVVERNVMRENTYMKKPNKYRILMDVKSDENDTVIEIVNDNILLDYKELYYDNVIKLFNNKEIKELKLTKHQYYEFINYRKNVS